GLNAHRIFKRLFLLHQRLMHARAVTHDLRQLESKHDENDKRDDTNRQKNLGGRYSSILNVQHWVLSSYFFLGVSAAAAGAASALSFFCLIVKPCEASRSFRSLSLSSTLACASAWTRALFS